MGNPSFFFLPTLPNVESLDKLITGFWVFQFMKLQINKLHKLILGIHIFHESQGICCTWSTSSACKIHVALAAQKPSDKKAAFLPSAHGRNVQPKMMSCAGCVHVHFKMNAAGTFDGHGMSFAVVGWVAEIQGAHPWLLLHYCQADIWEECWRGVGELPSHGLLHCEVPVANFTLGDVAASPHLHPALWSRDGGLAR